MYDFYNIWISSVLFFNCGKNMYSIEFTILTIFNLMMLSTFTFVMQPSPSLEHFRYETWHPLNTNSPLPVPQPLGTILLLSVSINLTNLGTSYQWNYTIWFVLLCLGYFCLISLSIKFSGFIHVVAWVRMSLFFSPSFKV